MRGARLADLEFLAPGPGRRARLRAHGILLRSRTMPLSPGAERCRRRAAVVGNDDEYFAVVAQATDRIGGDVLAHRQFPVGVARDRIEDMSDDPARRRVFPSNDRVKESHVALESSRS